MELSTKVDTQDSSTSSTWFEGKVASDIESKLRAKFTPLHLSIVDESYKHAGHAGTRDAVRSGETHFKVQIVSEAFSGLPLIERHRAVNDCLNQELKEGVHALSIDAKTPAQWEAKKL